MNHRRQFRAAKKLRLNPDDAALKPLSSGDKLADKQRVVMLAEQIAELQNVFYAARSHKLLIVLQGMDTSGKDGTVSSVFGRIDPLGVRSVAFKAPTQVEREHDFLWRIHQQVPAQGEVVIFNRSHYEDVLVPRVHDLIDDAECERRIGHIRAFEQMLTDTGTVLLKFFLHISKDEQKRRLEQRLADPDKHWKFDQQDIAERKFWDAYQRIYIDTISATNTRNAPWYVIPANSKTHRNLAVASVVHETLDSLALRYPPAHPEYFKIKID